MTGPVWASQSILCLIVLGVTSWVIWRIITRGTLMESWDPNRDYAQEDRDRSGASPGTGFCLMSLALLPVTIVKVLFLRAVRRR